MNHRNTRIPLECHLKLAQVLLICARLELFAGASPLLLSPSTTAPQQPFESRTQQDQSKTFHDIPVASLTNPGEKSEFENNLDFLIQSLDPSSVPAARGGRMKSTSTNHCTSNSTQNRPLSPDKNSRENYETTNRGNRQRFENAICILKIN